jgi:ATP-dependent protease ClpP protease subunit
MNPAEMRLRLRNYARSQPATQWFKIINQANGPTKVAIYDEIGFFGVTAADFNDQIGAIDGSLEVYINSPGGEIFDGISIYNQLLSRQRDGSTVSVFIDGIAASAASYIAMAASPGKLGIAETGEMMIHNGQAFAAGDAAELRKMAEILDTETEKIANIYAKRSGRPVEDFKAMMDSEKWLSAAQTVAEGLADYMYDPRTGPTNILARRSVRNATSDNGWKQVDGSWVYDPDGDGDDDYQAPTDTDNDYWAPDGTQLKAIPAGPPGSDKPAKPMPDASNRVPLWNADSVDTSTWDGDKAMANGAASDDPAAFYKAICAGEHTTGDPSTQAHWALPYKYTPSSPPNKAGVANALARLDQTKDLKDPAGVKSKLEGIMKKINPDYEPSDDVNMTSLSALLLTTLRGGK